MGGGTKYPDRRQLDLGRAHLLRRWSWGHRFPQEIPVLEQETGIKTVTSGKYNALRDSMTTTPDTRFETIADIPPGSTICVASPVSASGFWGVGAQELHGLDFRVGSGDFELTANDHFVNPQNMLNGDCVAAILIPEAASPLSTHRRDRDH